MGTRTTKDRTRRDEWRSCEAKARHLVERVTPRAFAMAEERRLTNLPAPWKLAVDQLAGEVRDRVNNPDRHRASAGPEKTTEAQFASEWSLACILISDVMEYLQRNIRQDIGCAEGSSTLTSMALLEGALMQLQVELAHIGGVGGHPAEEENRYRVLRALSILHPDHDDAKLRRFRALRVAEESVRLAVLLDDAEVDDAVDRMRQHRLRQSPGVPWEAEDDEDQRRWFRVELPMQRAVFARSELTDIDTRFATLDALLVLEEFSSANKNAKGGKVDGGDGKTGPARALARLALTCGALGYDQAADETFDDAVDRVRTNLLVTRSRIRTELHAFPMKSSGSEGRVISASPAD